MRHAFTLVELSIVLVILGLLVGGVLAGQSLIHSAELRSVITDKDKVTTSMYAFRDKYFTFPGDLSNASAYWTSLPNGNGDGVVNYNGGGAGEEFYLWQHLGAAGLVEGTYSGGVTSVMGGRISNTAYRIANQSGVYGKSGLMMSVNKKNPNPAMPANQAALSVEDAYNLDTKLDDSKADSGSVMAFNQESVPGCVTNYHTSATGSYVAVLSSDVKCKMFFVLNR